MNTDLEKVRSKTRVAESPSPARSICFYSPWAASLFDEASPGEHGGAELIMFHLACASSRYADLEIHFLVNGPVGYRVDDCEISLHAAEPALRHGDAPRILAVFTNAVRGIRPFMRTRAQVFVLCGASITLGYVGLYRLFARSKRIHFIVASDADIEGSLLADSAFERFLYQIGLRLADVIWCQNRYQHEAIEARYGRKTQLLPNGLPVPKEPPPAPGRQHVLWVASCQPLKQPYAFLDLAESFPEEKFVMIMPPREDDRLYTEVQERASALRNVDFIGGVHYREIQRFFDMAKVFVNTSTVEGYPNAFVQSMIGATPILSLNVDPNGILHEQHLGICADGYARALRDTLRSLLDDDEMRAAMGARAFQYAREHHDIMKVAERFVAQLRGVDAG